MLSMRFSICSLSTPFVQPARTTSMSFSPSLPLFKFTIITSLMSLGIHSATHVHHLTRPSMRSKVAGTFFFPYSFLPSPQPSYLTNHSFLYSFSYLVFFVSYPSSSYPTNSHISLTSILPNRRIHLSHPRFLSIPPAI